MKMKPVIACFLKDERAATATEYALIGGLLSVAIVAGAWALGLRVGAMYEALGTSVPPPPAT
jgi:pilus assembly protein Flp/PilA